MNEDDLEDISRLLRRMGIDHRDFYLASPVSSQESMISDTHVEEQNNSNPYLQGENNSSAEYDNPDDNGLDIGGEKRSEDIGEEVEDNVAEILKSVESKLRTGTPYRICKECNARIEHRNLRRHMREVHDKVMYSCTSCGKSFQRKAFLEKHSCENSR